MTQSQKAVCNDMQEYQNLLIELVTEYIMEPPIDFVDFACNFFDEKILAREETEKSDESEGEREDHDFLPVGRRGAVCAHNIPEEEINTFNVTVHPKTPQQRDRLKVLLKTIILFKSVESDDMKLLIDAMQMKRVSPDEFVILQGEDGDYFYAIEEGRFVAERDNVVLKEYEDAGYFGELALLYNVPRACSVRALSEGVLWALDRGTFQKVLLHRSLETRNLYLSFINRVPILQNLSPLERSNLADAFQQETYGPGELIIREGDDADKMYFILKGSVFVKRTDPETGIEIFLNRLHEGDYFGELALINRKPRAASVFAEGTVNLICVTVEAFERLLGSCIDIMKRNMLRYQ